MLISWTKVSSRFTQKFHSAFSQRAYLLILRLAIDQLINIIANVGVLGGCGTVCSYLNATWEVEICNVICDIVGIMEFANLINAYVE